MQTRSLRLAQCVELACLMEVTAAKPGNVHRGSDFEDLNFFDFQLSAVALGPVMEQAAHESWPLGKTILAAVEATQSLVQTNTNLGTILLLAPLILANPEKPLSQATVAEVLQRLTPEDSHHVYQAILLAKPGGMGKVEEGDLTEPPPEDLLAAMQHAAERDLVAQQYVTDFSLVLGEVKEWLLEGMKADWPWQDTIIHAQIRLLVHYPDSLIARKCGLETALQARWWAQMVLDCGTPKDPGYFNALKSLDFWLRSDGQKRNPGTTADLIAAGLFVLLRDGELKPPFKMVV
ncbi:Triphosphoribosyl-dephospho-CoA synthase MdcB [Planctomycetales bacterium 10988]|nr:Triphosphoribosyl-dephospho-CoA synthase MdcB [Planctomycetales bacterium 10988]